MSFKLLGAFIIASRHVNLVAKQLLLSVFTVEQIDFMFPCIMRFVQFFYISIIVYITVVIKFAACVYTSEKQHHSICDSAKYATVSSRSTGEIMILH